ncbi:MAG: DNA polymerase III subunit beta [Phycisphaerae bacterium SM23_33]|nr:MAG: DNA polymerase III subunit beta [Phycisphaerae bacterium SM23_33]
MVTMSEIEEIRRRIGREFAPHRVVLFGSYADGTATEDSDVDLLVVMPFEGKSFRQSLEILNRLDLRIPVDVIARQPEDVDRRYAECDPLIREALDRGKVLYERDG